MTDLEHRTYGLSFRVEVDNVGNVHLYRDNVELTDDEIALSDSEMALLRDFIRLRQK